MLKHRLGGRVSMVSEVILVNLKWSVCRKRGHKLMSKLFKNDHHHFQIISLLQKFCHWKFPVSEEEAVEAKFGRRAPKKTRKSHLCKDWEILFAGAEKYFYLRCNVYGNLQMSDKWTGFANVANYFKSVLFFMQLKILSWPHYDGGILKNLEKAMSFGDCEMIEGIVWILW